MDIFFFFFSNRLPIFKTHEPLINVVHEIDLLRPLFVRFSDPGRPLYAALSAHHYYCNAIGQRLNSF